MRERRKVHAPYRRLKLALAGKGVLYRDVAKLLDITENTVQQKINGYSDFYLNEQRIICNTYGISPNVFFDDVVA